MVGVGSRQFQAFFNAAFQGQTEPGEGLLQARWWCTKLAGLLHYRHIAGIFEGDQLLVCLWQRRNTMPQCRDPVVRLQGGFLCGTRQPLEHLIGKDGHFAAAQIAAQRERLKVGGAECP